MASTNWVFTFQVPWAAFPKNLFDACKAGKRPPKRLRLQMIRILVDVIISICKKPKVKDVEKIAFWMISKYPLALKDEVEGIVIGSGLESLTTQIMYRCDNLRRSDSSFQHSGNTSNTSADLTSEEVDFFQTSIFLNEKDYDKIDFLMQKAYAKIRVDVGLNVLIKDMKATWPFLFEQKYLFLHFEKLMQQQQFQKKFVERWTFLQARYLSECFIIAII